MSIVLIVCGCRNGSMYNEPVFESREKVGTEVLSEDLGFATAVDLFIYKSYAVVIAYDRETGQWLHVYDKNSGEHLVSFVSKGRAQGEILGDWNNVSLDAEAGLVVFNDIMQGKRLSVDIERLVAGGLQDSFFEEGWLYDRWLSKIMQLDGGMTLCVNDLSPVGTLDTADVRRFKIKDWADNVLYSCDDYPFTENSFFRWNLYSMVPIDISPDRTKVAIATTRGAILETFRISGAMIERESVSYFIEPRIGNDPRPSLEDVTLGFSDICAADDCIYAIYDGVHKEFDKFLEVFQGVGIFGWDGHPKRYLDCGMRLHVICFDPEDGKLYAVARDEDDNCVLARTLNAL